MEVVPTGNERGRGRPPKDLSREKILEAMERTYSNRAASRYCLVSYPHYCKWAKYYIDPGTGKTLYELQNNKGLKGVPKIYKKDLNYNNVRSILSGEIPSESYDPKRLKEVIVYEGILPECCNRCGFSEKRVLDLRVPLVLNHKDSNTNNFIKENLEFLCYNCAFLYATSPITDRQLDKMEDSVINHGKSFDWEIDEYYKEHLQQLGLWKEENDN